MFPTEPVPASMYCLLEFAQAVHVKRMLESVTAKPLQNLWVVLTGSLMDQAAITWCMVFGSTTNNATHWRNVTPEALHGKTLAGLLAATDFTEDQWKEYWETIVDYRNMHAAHRDMSAVDKIERFPHYTKALEAAYYMYGQLRQLTKWHYTSDLRAWSEGVAKNMEPLARVAFTASADKFGPHMPGEN
jgi:hypothetical protein